MKTKFIPTNELNLTENGERVETPLENVIPNSFDEGISEEDEEVEIAFVVPYLEDEFKQWLMDKRGITAKSANEYIRAYESAYESLYDIVELDLYDSLHMLLEEIPELMNSDKSKAMAPGLVEVYVETMLEELDADEDAYTKAELRAMTTYHAFIVELSGSSDKKFIKEKTTSLPDENDFLSWLEKEYKMNYDEAGKIVSSVKNMDLILPSLVSDPMTFLDVLRALPAGSKRKNYIKMVRTKKKAITRNAHCSYKTIQNGFANIIYYLNFLNEKNKSNNE